MKTYFVSPVMGDYLYFFDGTFEMAREHAKAKFGHVIEFTEIVPESEGFVALA